MNANELADELERLYQQDIIDGVADLAMPEAATMLRQLQAENEALKKDLLMYKDVTEYWKSHPAELTDEEIIAEAQGVKYSELSIAVNDFYILFAKAILRKASEK